MTLPEHEYASRDFAVADKNPSEILGNIQSEFRPDSTNLIAGMVLGAMLVLGGVALALFVLSRDEPKALDAGNQAAKYAFVAVGSVLLPLVGIAVLIWCVRRFSHRILIGNKGLG